jgi:hypothetical protein
MSLDAYDLEPSPPVAAHNQQKECRNTTIYCVLSIVLFIASGAINNPLVLDVIPGGQASMTLLTLVIILGVVILCIWQFPRFRRS